MSAATERDRASRARHAVAVAAVLCAPAAAEPTRVDAAPSLPEPTRIDAVRAPVAAQPARGPNVDALRAWKVPRGTLASGRATHSFVLASDAAPGRYSDASMVTEAAIALPYQLSARWRRLGPEAGRSMHVLVAGGVVLIKSGAIAFYPNDDAGFAWAGWTPLPGYMTNAEHTLVVRQDAREVAISLDGAVVATFAPRLARDTAHLGFGMKSAPGLRSSIYVRDVVIASTAQ